MGQGQSELIDVFEKMVKENPTMHLIPWNGVLLRRSRCILRLANARRCCWCSLVGVVLLVFLGIV